MKKFYYTLCFSPFLNFVQAKNKKDALRKIKKIWSNYKNIEKILRW